MKIFKHPVILETACGHDGSVKTLKKLVDIATNTNQKLLSSKFLTLKRGL